jgi:hypothetical protein
MCIQYFILTLNKSSILLNCVRGLGPDGDAGVVGDPAEVAGDARENVRVAHLAAGGRAVRHQAHQRPRLVLF